MGNFNLPIEPVSFVVDDEILKLDRKIKELKEKLKEEAGSLEVVVDEHKSDFMACRICRKSGLHKEFKPLFAGDGLRARMLKMISGVDISCDKGKRSALICIECLSRLRQACKVSLEIKESESYFATIRELYKETETIQIIDEQSNQDETGEENKTVKDSSNRTRVKCLECSKFITNKFMRQHVKLVHENIRKFKCKLCEYKANRFSTLKRHVEYHKNPNYKFKGHNTSDKTRPLKCTFPDCGKRFEFKQNLQHHQKVHTNTRNFTCKCGKSFRSKRSLQRHQATKHK